MELHPHQNYNPYLSVNPLAEGCESRDPRDRFPQWTHAETQEFLAIRSELDKSFMETKRNKALWETISARLQQKGISRTPEQCKSKWKNLVTRFKGSEAMEGEAKGQFPFYEEMRRIFAERRDHQGKGKGVQVQAQEWEEEEEVEKEMKVGESKKKRKVAKQSLEGEVESVLRELRRRQSEMEARWMAAAEEREAERRAKEQEWRRAMVAMEEERMAMERRWREREEERRAREEARAERRHELVTALLTNLSHKEVIMAKFLPQGLQQEYKL